MTALKKDPARERERYVWECGRSPHSHTYPSPLLEGSFFFSALNNKLRMGYVFPMRVRSNKDWQSFHSSSQQLTSPEPPFPLAPAHGVVAAVFGCHVGLDTLSRQTEASIRPMLKHR